MKKQRNQFIAICVILVLAIGGYIGLRFYNKAVEEQEAAEEEANTIYASQISVDDITAISYTLDEVTYAYELIDDEWVYTDDTTIDIDEDEFVEMIDVLEDFTAEDAYGSDEYDAESLADFGLEEPSCTVIVTLTDGSIVEFYCGDYNLTSYVYYLMRSDDDRIFACGSNLSSSFTSTPDELAVEEDTETETEDTETETEDTETETEDTETETEDTETVTEDTEALDETEE